MNTQVVSYGHVNDMNYECQLGEYLLLEYALGKTFTHGKTELYPFHVLLVFAL